MGFHIDFMWKVWGCLGHSLRTGAAAFEHAYGADIFTYLTEHPQAGRQFDEAMSAFVSQSAEAIVSTFDFSRFERIVDVGGGNGTLIAAILKRNPRVRGVVFDLPAVVERAAARISSAGLSDRCECIAGDFFSAAPPAGDACILASILHDWDDEHALAILRSCRRAMATGHTLVIAEALIAPGDQPSFAKILDLTMLVINGGRQRTEGEFRNLLADAGFELKCAIPTWSSTETSILEAVAV
jgi:SAM-dependent methyltransferase